MLPSKNLATKGGAGDRKMVSGSGTGVDELIAPIDTRDGHGGGGYFWKYCSGSGWATAVVSGQARELPETNGWLHRVSRNGQSTRAINKTAQRPVGLGS